MHRIDSNGTVDVIPTPGAVGGTVGYFSEGNPSISQKATAVSADWLNAVQEELANVVEGAGMTLDKTSRNQVFQAIQVIGGGFIIDVKAHGAVGNGTADDTVAIQAAFTAAAAATYGATVYFPPGIYKTTAELVYPDKSGCALIGEGRGQSVLKFSWGGSPSTVAYGIKISTASAINGVLIKGLTLQGSANTDSAIWELIRVNNDVSGVQIIDCEMKWSRHAGLNCSQSPKSNRLLVQNCYLHHINSSAMTGVAGAALENLMNDTIIDQCTFEDIGNGGSFHAVYFSGADITNGIVTKCIFKGSNTNFQIFDNDNARFVIAGNIFYQCTVFVYDVLACEVSGNTFYDAILKPGGDGIHISGNYFHMTGTGFSQIPCDVSLINIKISGNIFFTESPSDANIGIFIDSGATTAATWTIDGNTFLNMGYSAILYGNNHVVSNNRIKTTGASEQIALKSGTGHCVVNNVFQLGSGDRAVNNASGSAQFIKGNVLLGGAIVDGGDSISQPMGTTGVRERTANWTLQNENDNMVTMDATGGARTVTLPALASSLGADFFIKRMNSGGNAVTLARAGSDTIDGATSKSLDTQYACIHVRGGVTAWHVISTFGTVS